MGNKGEKHLRICLDARLISGKSGGIEQVIIAIANWLSTLNGCEEYFFLTYNDSYEWLLPYLNGSCNILRCSETSLKEKIKEGLKNILPRYAPTIWPKVKYLIKRDVSVQPSDGTIEKSRINIMHFTTPNGFITKVPSIYQPHDLQHLELPHFFDPHVRMSREVIYRTLCEQARMVAVMSVKGKEEIIRHYGLPADKVQIIPWASVLNAYPTPSDDDIAEVQRKFSLPMPFIFYPAQTWPHKNHIGLLKALAILRDRYEMTIPLVCSGHLTEFFSTIKNLSNSLRLSKQIYFLGFVTTIEIQCLYRLSRCLVFPSFFEGWGLPLSEAFLAGVPVACSNISPLIEQAGDSALLFDPNNPEEIALSVSRLWSLETLRKALIEKGKNRASLFSWKKTVLLFRAHYRRLTGCGLTEEDQKLLAAPPLL
jgi:glycosyltransferase involved in cell wall biosynthesis